MSRSPDDGILATRGTRRSALAEAIRDADVPRVRALVDADPCLANAGNSHGNDRPLSIALDTDFALAKLLVDLGADVNAANHGGWSHLDGAALAGDARTCAWLVSRGAEARLHHAAALNDVDLLGEMLRADTTGLEQRLPPGRGRTPLMFAAYSGAGRALGVLLAAGAAIDATDHVGRTALHFAVERGHAPCASALLEAGADPDRRGPDLGGSVVHQAVRNRDAEMVRLLAWHDADTGAFDASGNTPLHRAVRVNVAMAKLLIEVGAPADLPSARGETPLELAQRLGKAKALAVIDRPAPATPPDRT